MSKFLVATGIVIFPIEAESPRHAIVELKARINRRRHEHHNPDIGMSLVNAYDAGTLNFLVMDERRRPICGEFNGVFQYPASQELVASFSRCMPATSDFGGSWRGNE